MNRFLIILLLVSTYLQADAKSASYYNTLNPYSVSEQLAFYELYPNTKEGRAALKKTFSLLGSSKSGSISLTTLQNLTTDSFISLVNRSSFAPLSVLSPQELQAVEILSEHLPHKKLKGHHVFKEEEVISLPTEDIDLSRGLLISQLGDEASIKQYEAALDLMALQILAKLQKEGGLKASPEQKIEEMNQFIFNDLHFRFPPNSDYAPDIDQYTFLPSVLDSRRGVCLGVSILYLSIAQRIDLPLEIVTPPGHIFVRFCKGDKIINIETTARGANTPTEMYLGINTKSLKQRDVKQSIGLAHFNQAAVFSRKKEYEKAVASYNKAMLYMPNDPLVSELLGFHLLFLGRIEEGSIYLRKIKEEPFPGAIAIDPTAEDFLNGKVDAEGIEALFFHAEDNQTSVLAKQQVIQKSLNKFPEFRAGLLQLASTWLQLSRTKEAQEALERYHILDNQSPEVEFQLAALYAERFDFNKAWKALRRAEKITLAKDHAPKAIRSFKDQLASVCPEPLDN